MTLLFRPAVRVARSTPVLLSKPLLLTTIPQLCSTPTRQRRAPRPRGRTILRPRPQTPLRKTLPDLALINTTRKCRISIQDSIARLDEVRTARLPTNAIVSFSAKNNTKVRNSEDGGELTAPCHQ